MDESIEGWVSVYGCDFSFVLHDQFQTLVFSWLLPDHLWAFAFFSSSLCPISNSNPSSIFLHSSLKIIYTTSGHLIRKGSEKKTCRVIYFNKICLEYLSKTDFEINHENQRFF